MRTSAKTKERVANIHNKYAYMILASAGDDPSLKALANAHIQELPRASYKRDLAEYARDCQAKLDAFRADAQRLGLAGSLVILDENATDRAALAEHAADERANAIKETVANTGERVIKTVNTHTDEVGAGLKNTVKNEGAATRRQVRATGRNVIRQVNRHTTAETDRGISANAQNTSAIVGVDAPGYTVQDEKTGQRLLYNGEAVEESAVYLVNWSNRREADRVIREVNEHTTQVSQLTQQQTQVLQSKRQAISDMLTKEQTEAGFGVGLGVFGAGISSGLYKDKTIKWLGSAADRVMADSELSFDQKKEALDELIRMVDEENVIDDSDRAAFESKYLKETREHDHI